jgi:hypothetical protein
MGCGSESLGAAWRVLPHDFASTSVTESGSFKRQRRLAHRAISGTMELCKGVLDK